MDRITDAMVNEHYSRTCRTCGRVIYDTDRECACQAQEDPMYRIKLDLDGYQTLVLLSALVMHARRLQRNGDPEPPELTQLIDEVVPYWHADGYDGQPQTLKLGVGHPQAVNIDEVLDNALAEDWVRSYRGEPLGPYPAALVAITDTIALYRGMMRSSAP